jgi:hypothetical protein
VELCEGPCKAVHENHLMDSDTGCHFKWTGCLQLELTMLPIQDSAPKWGRSLPSWPDKTRGKSEGGSGAAVWGWG